MYKIILILLILPFYTFADEWNNNFDNTGIPVHIEEHYDSNSDTKIPEDAVELGTDDDRRKGREIHIKNITSYKTLGNVLETLQSGKELTTLGDTYICLYDNETYTSLYDCNKQCSTKCDIYKFTADITCQKSIELIKVEPVNMFAVKTPFKITYKKQTYKTDPIDSICSNGYISNGKNYKWNITKDSFGKTIVDSQALLGECLDVSKASFIAQTTTYYNAMGYAFKAHISKLGYIPSYSINKDSTMSINILVAGACNGGELQTNIPHKNIIADIGNGRLDTSVVSNITKNDELYNMVTSKYNESTKYNYSDFIKQDNTITNSADLKDDGSYTFIGVDIDGGINQYNTNINLTEQKCIPSCKVSIPANNDNLTVTLPDGKSVTKYPVLKTSYYKACKLRNNKYFCEAENNEEIINNECACADDFLDTIVNMKFIDEASKNMKCSSK